jgi:DNA mismatch repair ATPase MutS
LSSFAALVNYLKLESNIISNVSLICAEFQKESDVTFIDSSTAKYIELVSSLNNKKRNKTLFSVINNSLTKNGVSLLRSNLLEPPFTFEIIEKRQKLIEIILSNLSLKTNLEKAIKQSDGIDEITQFFHHFSTNSREYEIINLKSSEKKFKIILRIKNAIISFQKLKNETKEIAILGNSLNVTIKLLYF